MSPESRTGLVVFGVAAGVFLVAAAGVGALVLFAGGKGTGSISGGGGGPGLFAGKPRPTEEGTEWTISDLMAHLNRNGVNLEQKGGGEQQADWWVIECRTDRGTYMNIYQHRDARSASDTAGAKREWSWGRFR